MNIKLEKVPLDDAERLWRMQVEAFTELYEKYKDSETNPAAEGVDRIIGRLNQTFTYYYYIDAGNCTVGAIRVINLKDQNSKKISPIFIMPEYRNRGYAQGAILEAEKLHGKDNWELATIMQEAGNCHLYEKMGYVKTGDTKIINEKMTLVFYRK